MLTFLFCNIGIVSRSDFGYVDVLTTSYVRVLKNRERNRSRDYIPVLHDCIAQGRMPCALSFAARVRCVDLLDLRGVRGDVRAVGARGADRSGA